jgi:hypothetical protein
MQSVLTNNHLVSTDKRLFFGIDIACSLTTLHFGLLGGEINDGVGEILSFNIIKAGQIILTLLGKLS